MSKVIRSDLAIIAHPKGDILHAMKSHDSEFKGFGEAYFSKINYGCIKGWKRHSKMTLNLVCPHGKVKFMFYTDLVGFDSETIGEKCYKRLTVPPGIWFAFQGLGDPVSLIMNISNIEHDIKEVDKRPIDSLRFVEERLS